MLTEKDKNIIKDAEENGTPIFVLTAKDIASVKTLTDYAKNTIDASPTAHTSGAISRIYDFYHWQMLNPDKVKVAD